MKKLVIATMVLGALASGASAQVSLKDMMKELKLGGECAQKHGKATCLEEARKRLHDGYVHTEYQKPHLLGEDGHGIQKCGGNFWDACTWP